MNNTNCGRVNNTKEVIPFRKENLSKGVLFFFSAKNKWEYEVNLKFFKSYFGMEISEKDDVEVKDSGYNNDQNGGWCLKEKENSLNEKETLEIKKIKKRNFSKVNENSIGERKYLYSIWISFTLSFGRII